MAPADSPAPPCLHSPPSAPAHHARPQYERVLSELDVAKAAARGAAGAAASANASTPPMGVSAQVQEGNTEEEGEASA
eukprot:scaffold217188_cov26-Tisochrysis_lutea.AAC.2